MNMRLREINEVKESDLISITPEWMAAKYDEMNRTLFNGVLGSCKFEVFTTGKGMNGGTLGWFRKDTFGLKYKKSSRRMFKYDALNREIWVDKNNFVEMCNPVIALNGNYRWTEKAALTTLVHEMCHYYCYMNGFVPKQSHGYEFKSIAARVSAMSNNIFTIERLASAEEMSEMELDANIKAKVDRIKDAKMERAFSVVSFMKNGIVELVNLPTAKAVNELVARYHSHTTKMVYVSDMEFKKMIFNSGFGSIMRSISRYWDVTRKPWVKDIEKYEHKVLYSEN